MLTPLTMPRKSIVSVTLDNDQIARLRKVADADHKGNVSKALRQIIMNSVSLDLSDYEHPYPLSARNWKGSGRCNPFNATVGTCVLCWGEGARVMVYRDWNGKERIVVDGFVQEGE